MVKSSCYAFMRTVLRMSKRKHGSRGGGGGGILPGFLTISYSIRYIAIIYTIQAWEVSAHSHQICWTPSSSIVPGGCGLGWHWHHAYTVGGVSPPGPRPVSSPSYTAWTLYGLAYSCRIPERCSSTSILFTNTLLAPSYTYVRGRTVGHPLLLAPVSLGES